jgi:hypothetical protein
MSGFDDYFVELNLRELPTSLVAQLHQYLPPTDVEMHYFVVDVESFSTEILTYLSSAQWKYEDELLNCLKQQFAETLVYFVQTQNAMSLIDLVSRLAKGLNVYFVTYQLCREALLNLIMQIAQESESTNNDLCV